MTKEIDRLNVIRNHMLNMLDKSEKSLTTCMDDLDDQAVAVWLCQQSELAGGVSLLDDKLEFLRKKGDNGE